MEQRGVYRWQCKKDSDYYPTRTFTARHFFPNYTWLSTAGRFSKRIIEMKLTNLILALFAVAAVPSLALLQTTHVQVVNLDGSTSGKRFDGIGIVNGGGATSVLLKDYPE